MGYHFPVIMLFLALILAAGQAGAQLDKAKIVADYKAWDLQQNEGKGHSDKPDSGTLGWGEAGYLRSYIDLWETTADPYWLGKIEDHFRRMMGTATDHDGDGFVGWQTATYSVGIYRCRALHNVGTAAIEPEEKRITDGKVGKLMTGHIYIIEFLDPASFRIEDQDIRQPLVEQQAYESGQAITDIPGCTVTITGEGTHQGDKFMVTTTPPEPTEFSVHEGMVAYPVALFIEAVKKDPALQERFGQSADDFLAFMTRNFLQKHEQHWLDMGEGAGAYRFIDLITDRFPNRIMPHNQFLALARTYLVLKDVPGADPLYLTRAEEMARYFKRYLTPQDEAYVWHYWDWIENGEPGNSGFEDTSHGTIDVGFAIDAARRGVVFTDEDLQRMTRTYLDIMWNGDESDPKVGPNVATKGDGSSILTHDWLNLCQWEPRIYELALTAYEKNPTFQTGVRMLVAEQRCGE